MDLIIANSSALEIKQNTIVKVWYYWKFLNPFSIIDIHGRWLFFIYEVLQPLKIIMICLIENGSKDPN